MSVKIRLARGGSKKRPYYRIVVADIRMPRDGRYIERVGSYNPLLPKDHEDRVSLDKERIIDWLSKGAKPTDRVARFLDEAGILKREPRNNPQKAKPKKEPEPKEEAVAEEAKAEEAPAEEAPAEEAPVEEAKAEEAPAEEAPAEEVKAEEAPADKEDK
tara:strand:+ start:573 stop:1049 length:477 start_codon:yes stop_codon:yes gene_type:complete